MKQLEICCSFETFAVILMGHRSIGSTPTILYFDFYVYVYMYMYMCICICIYVYIYVYICMYIKYLQANRNFMFPVL